MPPQTFDPSKPFTVFDPSKSFTLLPDNPPPAATTQYPPTIGDFLAGIGKSAASLIEGGGNLLRGIPGVDAASKAIGEVNLPINLEPTNPTQAKGKMVGDVAQFFIPIAGEEVAAAKLGAMGGKMAAKVPAIAKNMTLTAAQGGGTGGTLASGAITAALPGVGAGQRVSQALKTSAEKNVAQALGATTNKMKGQAARLAPEMIERGISGSRATMLQQARSEVAEAGAAIGKEIQAANDAGTTISAQAVREHMAKAMPNLITLDASGVVRVVPGKEAVVKQLDKLDKFIISMGPDIPVAKAHELKMAWQEIVANAGLYGPQAAGMADKAKAEAFKAAASGLRAELHSASGTLESLDKEFSFWKGLKDVLSKTELRTQAQGSGLMAGIGAATGATAGAMMGGYEGAGVGAILGQQMVKLIQSPYWKTTVTAPLKNQLADALASGNASRIATATKTILAAVPAQVSK